MVRIKILLDVPWDSQWQINIIRQPIKCSACHGTSHMMLGISYDVLYVVLWIIEVGRPVGYRMGCLICFPVVFIYPMACPMATSYQVCQ